MAGKKKTVKVSPFKNEPMTDFSKPANRKAFEKALKTVESQLGKEYNLIINGDRIRTNHTMKSLNPANREQVIGVFFDANEELANKAVEIAHERFLKWRTVPAAKRAQYLFKAANLMRKRKHEFSAWMVYEVGKSWAEADGDTAEAIDFMEFYGREMLRYGADQPLTKVPNEKNELVYIPLGVGAVIPPWNFPLAIMVGMTTAAVVTGNTVVLKPSSDSPTIAYKFVELLEEVGLPKGVVNFLPGPGSGMGDALVKHPKTRFIAFTGSKAVGLHINKTAAETQSGQLWIKRVVAEMGGKDSIIVDNEADLDKAAEGVLASAFGFQGQKCSACSRAIVVESVHEKFMSKLLERAKKLTIGDPTNYTNYMGPVINEKAMKSMMWYIDKAKQEGGEIVFGGTNDDKIGNFVMPTIVDNVKPKDTISQEEIFGPVLAVIKAKNYDEALDIANNTEYGLTGAVYSKNRKKLERAKEEFHVGNLYFNRKCTGALVGVHPFGGFNMSGTDSKAGGRDYLLLFLQAKAMSEKVK
ncbi:L-glutamate gamma-semialdehyde dehydrogenase [bacterium]|nr:L-glutamate gamma-semialdehyde dehydrogenase [bacterium]